jgi:hypothetical protein
MGHFKLPKTLCKSVNSTIIRFWWDRNNNSYQCSWLCWDKIEASKAQGGMGFRDLETFNSTMLAKQGWRLLQLPNSLVATVLKEKYYRGSNFLYARLGHNPSYAWRSIVNARAVLERGLFWRVGNGESI